MSCLNLFLFIAACLFHVARCSLIDNDTALAGSDSNSGNDDDVAPTMDSEPMLKNFLRKIPHVPTSTLKKLGADLMKETNEKKEAIAKTTGRCEPDWSAPCPLLWRIREHTRDGESECEAPPTYSGLCKTALSFSLYTAEAKQDWASACGVQWPCKGDDKSTCPDGRDFSRPCPESFQQSDDGSCYPDVSQYTGSCGGKVNFEEFSLAAKRDWSESCGAFWPCADNCAGQYNAPCPVYWDISENGDCLAPAHYNKTGRCDGKQNFQFYTAEMKLDFQQKCNVRFPCDNTCQKNYTSRCPVGWNAEESYCVAPGNFTACSERNITFVEFTAEDKAAFESQCDVDWPCANNDACARDWTQPCPESWSFTTGPKDTNDEYTCVPWEKYSGLCKSPEGFGSFSEKDKRHWASNCHAPWPCAGSTPEIASNAEKSLRELVLPAALGKWLPGSLSLMRPRPVYHVGTAKRGPIHHDTGEIMPKTQDTKATLNEVLGNAMSVDTERASTELGLAHKNVPAPVTVSMKMPSAATEIAYTASNRKVPHGFYQGGYYSVGSGAS